MNELISGKEALIALANGEEVEYQEISRPFNNLGWCDAKGVSVHLFLKDDGLRLFRLKPRTIMINNIEVPAPICNIDKLKEDNSNCKDFFVYYLDSVNSINGYSGIRISGIGPDSLNGFGYSNVHVWLTEEEIKQVVNALREVFK